MCKAQKPSLPKYIPKFLWLLTDRISALNVKRLGWSSITRFNLRVITNDLDLDGINLTNHFSAYREILSIPNCKIVQEPMGSTAMTDKLVPLVKRLMFTRMSSTI